VAREYAVRGLGWVGREDWIRCCVAYVQRHKPNTASRNMGELRSLGYRSTEPFGRVASTAGTWKAFLGSTSPFIRLVMVYNILLNH
jgi:hypothetical protein